MSRLTDPLDALLDADHGDWQPLLQRWRAGPAGAALVRAVDARVAAGANVFPAQVFHALAATPLARVKVVILGQDPYHGAGQAEGLAFSVPEGVRPPPSLRNIFKELQRDLGLPPPASGSLQAWARQGVLLLNTSLTVEEGLAGSHSNFGWHALTDAICAAAAEDAWPKAFLLWGAHAQAKAPLVRAAMAKGRAHRVFECNHPSPLSALRPPHPFIGCGHFGLVNAWQRELGRELVDWRLA